jgi:tetratricopeptide (TPR) repeat protein
MCGVFLHADGCFADAIEAFDRAEALGSRAAVSNLGNSLMDLGRMEDALRAHEAAVEKDPHCAGAQYNLALVRLRLGDWEQGWTGYEARWRFREVHRTPMKFKQPRWRGEPLQGRRILLHAEQGLGDAIQFSRYAGLVADRGGEVILQVHEPVERLMHSLAVVPEGRAQVTQLGVAPPDFDLECPLMSLPAVFGTTVETVPWFGSYLGAEPGLAAERGVQFCAMQSDILRVGLAWAGNPRYKADGRRSMKLATLSPLLRTEDVFWVSLQKGEAAEQLKEMSEHAGILDGSSGDKNLAETAALVARLDLVITTDTCIAHLAGSMGKPLWILLPHLADWRWMEKVETTAWYPTARLFRQQSAGDWAGVLERVSAELWAFRSQRQALEMFHPTASATARERAA